MRVGAISGFAPVIAPQRVQAPVASKPTAPTQAPASVADSDGDNDSSSSHIDITPPVNITV